MFGFLKYQEKVLPEFESTKICMACGNSEYLRREWVPGKGFDDYWVPSHIEAICQKCGCPHSEKLHCQLPEEK